MPLRRTGGGEIENLFAVRAEHGEHGVCRLLLLRLLGVAVSSKSAEALLKEYQTLCCTRQLGDDVFSVSCGGDPAVAYDRLTRRTLLMQRMEEVLTPRELNLVRSYLGIGQPDEVGMTFQELAIRLNYNGPSGAEKAYKTALWKLKRDLHVGPMAGGSPRRRPSAPPKRKRGRPRGST